MLRKIWLIAAICLVTGGSGWAALIIDQNQPNADALLATFEQPDLAQSFQQANNNIAGAGIFLKPFVGTGGLVTISLWNALPNAGGNQLATASAPGSPGAWLDVFWNPIAITPNTTYFLVFTSATTLGIGGGVDPYSRGQAYANAGFQAFPLFDYTFRTYYDNNFVPGVPENGPTVLFLALTLTLFCLLGGRLPKKSG